MLTSKQRSSLRAMAHDLEPIYQVGKSGVTPEIVAGLDEALEARELIKLSVLQSCEEEPRAVAETLGGRTRAEVVQVIGRKVVLYRRSKKKPTIEV